MKGPFYELDALGPRTSGEIDLHVDFFPHDVGVHEMHDPTPHDESHVTRTHDIQ